MPRPELRQAATEMTIESPFPPAARLFGLPFLAVDEAALACGQQVASFLGLRLEDRRRPDGAPEDEGEDAD